MAVKKTGISLDLIIHPGETIADVLEERGLTQVELAARTGVTPAYVSNVISGKKDISASFAMSLEYALGVPKSFWLNLQANYDAEILEYNEEHTVTEEEKEVRGRLLASKVIKYLRDARKIPDKQTIVENIISMRTVFQVSNLCNLKDLVPSGAFRLSSNTAIDPYVLGAWLRICQICAKNEHENLFDVTKTDELINELKSIMINHDCDLQSELSNTMMKYGIDFTVLRNFRGAPVHGYISQKSENRYQMALTIRGAYADIFWFSIFHELGHIVNGDVSKSQRFIDVLEKEQTNREIEADKFALNALINPSDYKRFVDLRDFTITAIKRFARMQKVMPYIVIGRLQKEGLVPYSRYSEYKLRYKWAE